MNGWVVWKINRSDPTMASVRYRCLLPVLAHPELRARSVILAGDRKWRSLSGVAALVFVKSFRTSDVLLARGAHAAGVPIFVDLCDNIFANGYGGRAGAHVRAHFTSIAALSRAIVVSSDALAELLAQALPEELSRKLIVQPDPFETVDLVHSAVNPSSWPNRSCESALTELRVLRSLPHMIRNLLQLQAAFKRDRDAMQSDGPAEDGLGLPQVLWFGRSGNAHSSQGIAALSARMPELCRAHAKTPFRLKVVSDRRDCYETLVLGRGIPTTFEPWGALSIFDALQASALCLLPAMADNFSKAKSANRLLLALAHQVPVVASSIDAYARFGDCVVLDDFARGIQCYLTSSAMRQEHLKVFETKYRDRYDPRTLANLWVKRLT